MNQTERYFDKEDITQLRKWMENDHVHDVYTYIASRLGLKEIVTQFECIQRLRAYTGTLEPGLLEVQNLRVQRLRKALMNRLDEVEYRIMSEFV